MSENNADFMRNLDFECALGGAEAAVQALFIILEDYNSADRADRLCTLLQPISETLDDNLKSMRAQIEAAFSKARAA